MEADSTQQCCLFIICSLNLGNSVRNGRHDVLDPQFVTILFEKTAADSYLFQFFPLLLSRQTVHYHDTEALHLFKYHLQCSQG